MLMKLASRKGKHQQAAQKRGTYKKPTQTLSDLLVAEISGFRIAVLPATPQLYNLNAGTQLRSYVLVWKQKTLCVIWKCKLYMYKHRILGPQSV